MTAGRSNDRDEAMEDELRAVFARVDAAPDRIAERARGALAGTGPAESGLLEIAYDSVLDVSLGRYEPGESVRLVAFEGTGLRLELRLDPSSSGATLAGWTAPVRAHDVALHTEQTSSTLPVHADGTFRASDMPRGRIRLHVAADIAGALRRFHTSWFKW